ncbi:XF1762 family protein [Falsiroseomonas tokyonensis]|uniref:XF1762 family protein n=1 Tax=Falsiroseomonas tokyonensis TaxID=430521 RepID=A0ABV7C0K7_9PROT|nr:XF1762 family protein [Falsiroseomonas tokyonensis]MBU8540194.1 hypothetical protein [Falsiroseomonas tokyonensis]
MPKLAALPMTLREVSAVIGRWHRHNRPARGWRWGFGAEVDGSLVGVVVVGRPTSRVLQADVRVAEVTRLCVLPDAPKGTCSFLYAAAWRAWSAMGGARIVTYTLQSESGASLRGAGWVEEERLEARAAAGWKSRPGRVEQAVVAEAKIRWGRW